MLGIMEGSIPDTSLPNRPADEMPISGSTILDGEQNHSSSEGDEWGRGTRSLCYSRSELESLRSVNVEEQRMLWNGILQGFESVAAQEYDGLSESNQKRKQKKERNKKKAFQDEVRQQSLPKRKDVLNPSDTLACVNFDDEDNSMVHEEVYDDEEEDSDDDYNSIQKLAFLVEGEPDFDSGPPEDGLEYLRRVRWEAAQIPNVKVAKLDKSKCREQTPYMPKIPDVPKCPENLLPLKHWEDIFLADFSNLRQAFQHLESSEDQPFVAKDKDSRGVKPCPQLPKDHPPTARAMLAMDAVTRATMLGNHIRNFEDADALSKDICLWIFALCVVVDEPLDARMSASMRCLLRKCSTLLASKSESDDEVAMLNILVVISGKYFQQSEK